MLFLNGNSNNFEEIKNQIYNINSKIKIFKLFIKFQIKENMI